MTEELCSGAAEEEDLAAWGALAAAGSWGGGSSGAGCLSRLCSSAARGVMPEPPANSLRVWDWGFGGLESDERDDVVQHNRHLWVWAGGYGVDHSAQARLPASSSSSSSSSSSGSSSS